MRDERGELQVITATPADASKSGQLQERRQWHILGRSYLCKLTLAVLREVHQLGKELCGRLKAHSGTIHTIGLQLHHRSAIDVLAGYLAQNSASSPICRRGMSHEPELRVEYPLLRIGEAPAIASTRKDLLFVDGEATWHSMTIAVGLRTKRTVVRLRLEAHHWHMSIDCDIEPVTAFQQHCFDVVGC